MFDSAGPSAEPSTSRSLQWARVGLLGFVVLAIGLLVVVVVARNNRAEPIVAPMAQPAVPSTPSDAKAATEVEIGTEVVIGGWRLVPDATHDVKDAGNAGTAPDQRDAVIFPGGELALAYGNGEAIGDGPGPDLSVYGTDGDRTPYTVFVRSDASVRWIHLDANRAGFPRGIGAHDIRRQRVRQIKIRNDGTTNLFVDAVGVVKAPAAVADNRSVARSAPVVQPAPSGSARAPASAAPVKPSPAAAAPPTAKPTETVTIEPYRTPISPAQPDVVPPDAAAPPRRDRTLDAPTNLPASARGTAAPIDTPRDRSPVATPGVEGARGPLDPPQRIRRVPAQYPRVAQMANVEGTVVIEAIVNERGQITSPRILKSIPLLDQAALDAVKQWEFKPATRDGRPVAVTVKLSVEFVLP